MLEKTKKVMKGSVSEEDISTLLQRYTATTVLTLLQEVAHCPDVKIDWNTLVKNTSTGISDAREYQMLWHHLAYRHALLGKLEYGASPLSNVRKEVRKKPDPPCVVCKGSGRTDCHHCRGRGRTNSVHLAMLPKGEWPKWCRTCGGSGLSYCSRCVGTGEYRYIMGFHFMKMDVNHTQDQKKYEVQGDRERCSDADLLLNEE